MVKYVLRRTVVALDAKARVTEIPAGAIVEAPAALGSQRTVQIVYKGQSMKVLAIDFLDAAVPGAAGEA